MRVDRLWLRDFRSYEEAGVTLAPSLTALVGANGAGKTNLVEAVAFLATLGSFRGAPSTALIRSGAEQAVVRAEAESGGRALLIEAEITEGRTRAQVNRQGLARARDLLGLLRTTVFAPDDLELVKGGPAERRRYLDDLLVALHPRNDKLRSDLDRVLRQRASLLKQAAGRLTPEVEATLEVWDERLVQLGEAVGRARTELVTSLQPLLAEAYEEVSRGAEAVTVAYRPEWYEPGLAAALAAARPADLRRGANTVGPHRDEVELHIAQLPARTHASQGEQRSLSFALRVSAHRLVTEAVGAPPVLLLDDVFSELDPERARALLGALPRAQTLLTTAGGLPEGAQPELVIRVGDGRLWS